MNSDSQKTLDKRDCATRVFTFNISLMMLKDETIQ